MTSDPQHLITLSLGKIAMARSRRGGVNLHKNLLVASVLHRARTRYVMETYTPLISPKKYENEPDTEDCDNSPVIVAPYNSLTIDSDPSANTIADDKPCGALPEMDKENKPPMCESSSDIPDAAHDDGGSILTEEIRDRLGISTLDNNNTEQNTVEQKNYIELSPVKSALKRRLSRQSSISSPQLVKRVRHSPQYDPHVDTSPCTNSSHEPMHTESQISSLVSIFNTGFNGLCSGGRVDSATSCATELTDHNVNPYDLALPLTPPIVLSV